jgi:hypothetical protein
MTSLRLTEPVRLYLYGLALPVLAVLVGFGVIDGADSALWAAVIVAALAIPTTEIVRAHVYAPATVESKLRKGSSLT